MTMGKRPESAGGGRIFCFTKRQMKALHPDGYTVTGECRVKDMERKPPGSYSRFRYRVKGYREAADGYVAVLSSRLPVWIALLSAAAALAVGIAFAAGFLPISQATAPVQTPASSVPLDPNAQDYTGEKVPDNKGNPDAVNTQIPGYKTVRLDSKTGQLDIAPHNPEGNPCYFIIHLQADGEELYQSKMLAPGQALYDVSVDSIPKPGTYDAKIKYECFHLATLKPLNGAEIAVELIVE